MMRFYNRNQIELFTTIAASTGAGVANVYDRNAATVWTSVGSNDATTETIEVVWAAARTISAISLLTHNFKQFTVQYWNGSAYVDFSTPINETVNAEANNLFTFTAVSTLKVKISAVTTIVANAQKYIGEFLAYNEYFSLAPGNLWDTENNVPYYKQNEHEKADGGSVVVVEAMKPKYQNVFTFNDLLETYVDYITNLKNLHLSFWLMPDDSKPEKQYYVNMIQPQFDKVSVWGPAGEQCYRGSFNVKET
ncbi:MAG: hypothetical protein WC529_08850 [Candidatus Margulisiibacteriota bacterium]